MNTKKCMIVTIVISSVASIACAQTNFTETVSSLWYSGQKTNVLNIAEQRLQANSNDITGINSMIIYDIRISLMCTTLLFLTFLSAVLADDLTDFADDVNSAWSSTNDAQLISLINQRLNQDTNDVAALSAKMYYNIWVDGDITNAHLVATHLYAIVHESTNQVAVDVFAVMKAEVDAIPSGESGPFSQNALNQLRQETRGVFPNIQKCVWLARSLFVDE